MPAGCALTASAKALGQLGEGNKRMVTYEGERREQRDGAAPSLGACKPPRNPPQGLRVPSPDQVRGHA
jgi:hypothetical protein